jgi:hypothetical protein
MKRNEDSFLAVDDKFLYHARKAEGYKWYCLIAGVNLLK